MSGSWHALHGVEADLTCYSKAIANGHPLSVLLGSKKCRTEGAEKVGREKSPKQEIELKNVLRFLIFHSCRFTISLKKQSKALHNLFFCFYPCQPVTSVLLSQQIHTLFGFDIVYSFFSWSMVKWCTSHIYFSSLPYHTCYSRYFPLVVSGSPQQHRRQVSPHSSNYRPGPLTR